MSCFTGSRGRCIRVSGYVSVLFFCAGIGFGSAEPHQELDVFVGEWSQVDPDLDRATRLHAIEDAIDDLSWVLRTMAGPVLRNTTAPPHQMQFEWDGEHLVQHSVEKEGPRVRSIELSEELRDGEDSRGEPIAAAWNWTDDGLQLRWEQHQAHGQNLYRVDTESGTLIVEHTIQVTAISDVEPIVFESRFGRRTPAQVGAGRGTAKVEPAPATARAEN